MGKCYCPKCGTRLTKAHFSGKRVYVNPARVLELRQKGMKYKQIAARLGISTTMAWRIGEHV